MRETSFAAYVIQVSTFFVLTVFESFFNLCLFCGMFELNVHIIYYLNPVCYNELCVQMTMHCIYIISHESLQLMYNMLIKKIQPYMSLYIYLHSTPSVCVM